MKRWLCFGLAALLLSGALAVPAMAEEQPADVTAPEGQVDYATRLSDGNILTRVPLHVRDRITIPIAEAAQGIALKWQSATADYELIQLDAAGNTLLSERHGAGFLNRYHALLPACRQVALAAQVNCALCEAQWYEKDAALPDEVQQWESTPEERVDLLVIAAEPGEELWKMGGLLPLYTVEHGIRTAVVFLHCEKRLCAEEALAALWRLGIRSYPLFLSETQLHNPDSEKIVDGDWGTRNHLRDTLITLIRRFQPRVAVTGGFGAEDSPATQYAGRVLTKAAEFSDKEGYARPSIAAYGLWQLDKVYVQGESAEAGGLTTLRGAQPLVEYGGQTLHEATLCAYETYRSESIYSRDIPEDTRFTLSFSTVGADEACDDLFEHIDTGSLVNYIAPTPTPTPTPWITPSPTPTQLPAELPQDSSRAAIGSKLMMAVLALGALTAAALLMALRKKDMPVGQKAGYILLPLAAALLLSGGLHIWVVSSEPPEPSPPPAWTATPPITPLPTQSPTPSPVPTPTPQWPGAFREPGDPPETIEVDAENGHWRYKTDSLGIVIDRYTEMPEQGGIVTYFVAHIYMRDIRQFRPLFGSPLRNGRGTLMPWIMARRAGAVLMISGDNMINMEKDQKGPILRDGRVFSENVREDIIALYPDLSLRIHSPKDYTPEQLLCAGVENTFSFGPTLISDGILNEELRLHRVNPRNPRVGIGMVEPGHLVAIVVDGRDKLYSIGVLLADFAQMFAEQNCTEAYNLDGGATTAILFMGEQINYHANSPGDMQRPIPDGLAWGYSKQVPTEFDPVYNRGRRGE